MQPLMDTDSEELMRRGIETGRANFGGLLTETGWAEADIQKTVCHQVGAAHRKLMLESLGLNPVNDFSSFEILGNTGACRTAGDVGNGCRAGCQSSKTKRLGCWELDRALTA